MWNYLKKLSELEDFEVQFEYASGAMSKWVKFSETKSWQYDGRFIVHRKCLNKEIILDLDADILEANVFALYWLMIALDKTKIDYLIYYSGGKGFHLSMFFDWKIKYLEHEQKKVQKLTLSERVSVIRRAILDKIITDSGDESKFFVDLIDYQMIDVHRKLIRAEGSKHHKGNYKCLLPITAEQLWDIDLDLMRTKCILPESFKVNKITLGNVFTEKLQQIEEEKRLAALRPKIKYVNKIRPKVKNHLSQPLIDGKKQVLYILLRELKHKDYTREQAAEIINQWNDIHEEKLKAQQIIPQIEFAYKNKTYPLKNTTIDKIIKTQVTFKE